MDEPTITVIHEAAKETRQRRIAEGLCATCGTNPLKTKYACEACAARQAAYAREHRARRREQFLSAHGGMDGRQLRDSLTPEPTVKRCRVCLAYKAREEFPWNDKKSEIRKTICKSCDSKRAAKWSEQNPERRVSIERRRHLKRTYNLSHEDYARMLTEQRGVCAICGNPQQSSRGPNLCVDHCHDTRRVRGLLCFECNVAIGNLHHDTARLKAAIRYLEKLPPEKK